MKKRTIEELIDDVISIKNKQITDEVFLTIQNNSDLMYSYLRLVEEKGLDFVNQRIGVGVKDRYKLENEDQRNNNPESTLIQSHQKFK